MDSTTSVAKGCFVFKNGATRSLKIAAPTKAKRKRTTTTSGHNILGKEVTEQMFYSVYTEIWRQLESHIEGLRAKNCGRTLADLVEYVISETKHGMRAMYGVDEVLPTAVLLTGVNQPDHLGQFETVGERINDQISASICLLQSRDCITLKAAVETMVYNLIEASSQTDDDHDNQDNKRLKRSQCTMKRLTNWYRKKYGDEKQKNAEINSQQNHPLVVILPDFECFNTTILQDFILLLSSYCSQLPFVLILGVATSLTAIHNTLPFHVTSKIKLRAFQMQSACEALNEILDNVILSPRYSFHLSGKAFKFLTHIFLFYDFSISGFVQGYKYCLMEHYFQGNAYALCSQYSTSLKMIKSLNHDDMEMIRRLLSFRPYVESINNCKSIIAILTDDDYLKKKLPQLLRNCHVYFLLLHTFLAFLTELVSDLPKCPLGRHRRELYATALSKELVEQAEFKECWQMLSFLSKEEFLSKINKVIRTTENFVEKELKGLELYEDCDSLIKQSLKKVKELLEKVDNAGLVIKQTTPSKSPPQELKQNVTSRQELKERLLQMSKQEKKPATEFTKAVAETLSYIQTEIVKRFCAPLSRAPPLHELFVFADITTVRRNIIGAPRAALHMALNNPHFYLQCKCCQLDDNTRLLATLPDLSIVYKLHLECGRMINLFDWLQAFRSVVDCSDHEQEQLDPQIQARFTRAVAELQFLGYIKMSKRKTDHATRLTW